MADPKIRISDKRRGVFTVDNVVLNHYGKAMGPTGIALYVTLCRYASNQNQECWPSIAKIGEETGMSRKVVIFTAKKLEKLHLIKKRLVKGIYTIYTLLEPLEEGPEKDKVFEQYFDWLRTVALKATSVKNDTTQVKKQNSTYPVSKTTPGQNGTTTSVKNDTQTNLMNELNDVVSKIEFSAKQIAFWQKAYVGVDVLALLEQANITLEDNPKPIHSPSAWFEKTWLKKAEPSKKNGVFDNLGTIGVGGGHGTHQ